VKKKPNVKNLVLPPGEDTPARLIAVRHVNAAPCSKVDFSTEPECDNLPVLLAGPILRRADKEAIHIWVATSHDLSVTARVLRLPVEAGAPSFTKPIDEWKLLGKGTNPPMMLGSRLYVSLVRVPAKQGTYPYGCLLAYDLEFQARSEYKFTKERGLIPRDLITYGECPLPTFTLGPWPPDEFHPQPSDGRRKLQIAHASCRKLHGKGEEASVMLDAHIKDTWDQVDARPVALLLTGDQIYADDVDKTVAQAVCKASERLLGWRERLPFDAKLKKHDDHARSLKDPYDYHLNRWRSMPLAPEDGYPPELGKEKRKRLIRSTGLSSGPSKDHMMGFGEYAAMYLLAWSPSLWDYLKELKAQDKSTPLKKPIEEFLSAKEDDVRKNMKAMCRVLANVPSYMILDDHEVSDDWPMTYEQNKEVRASAIGSWVVANGVAAYWVFQHRGNTFGDASFEHALKEYLKEGLKLVKGEADRNFQDSVKSYSASMLAARGFGFVTPTTPPVLFLDTRTQRYLRPGQGFDLELLNAQLNVLLKRSKQQEQGADASKGPRYDWSLSAEAKILLSLPHKFAPGLLDPAALSSLALDLQKLPGDASMPVLLVSPSPVIGLCAFEDAYRVLESIIHSDPLKTAMYFIDIEMWSMEGNSYYGLFKTLASSNRRRFVIFSGDVHYGFMANAKFKGIGLPEIDIVQLTSSALKNSYRWYESAGLTVAKAVHLGMGRYETHAFYSEGDGGPVFYAERPSPTATPIATLGYEFSALANGKRELLPNNCGVATIEWWPNGAVHIEHKFLSAEIEGPMPKGSITLSGDGLDPTV
jgi:hypothetical protein